MKALAEEFANLEFTNEKTVLTDGTANQSSTYVIQKALARYDFIIGKYGSSTYSDFLGRHSASSSKHTMFKWG